MNILRIEALRTTTRIGVHAWEQRIDQVLLLDIDIPLSSEKLEQADDAIENTLDYDALCQHVTHLVESNAFKLIETVALRVIESVQSRFGVQAITVRVSKPHAIANASNISITMTRT
ncbi:MAG: dihydroneopterin aldolase [Legionellaceae bacterium]|nr:dihydroneopterin aldolase [Legionellaceae bacterium]